MTLGVHISSHKTHIKEAVTALTRLFNHIYFNYKQDEDANTEESNDDHDFWIINLAEKKKSHSNSHEHFNIAANTSVR